MEEIYDNIDIPFESPKRIQLRAINRRFQRKLPRIDMKIQNEFEYEEDDESEFAKTTEHNCSTLRQFLASRAVTRQFKGRHDRILQQQKELLSKSVEESPSPSPEGPTPSMFENVNTKKKGPLGGLAGMIGKGGLFNVKGLMSQVQAKLNETDPSLGLPKWTGKHENYIKLRKQPFGEHQATSQSLGQSPRFSSLMIQHKSSEPIESELRTAMNHRRKHHHRTMSPDRRPIASEALNERLNVKQQERFRLKCEKTAYHAVKRRGYALAGKIMRQMRPSDTLEDFMAKYLTQDFILAEEEKAKLNARLMSPTNCFNNFTQHNPNYLEMPSKASSSNMFVAYGTCPGAKFKMLFNVMIQQFAFKTEIKGGSADYSSGLTKYFVVRAWGYQLRRQASTLQYLQFQRFKNFLPATKASMLQYLSGPKGVLLGVIEVLDYSWYFIHYSKIRGIQFAAQQSVQHIWRAIGLIKMEGIQRPPVEDFNELLFMQMEIDYYTGMTPGSHQRSAILRMFGVTESGNSVLLHIHDFRPYFFVMAPPQHVANAFNAQQITEELNRRHSKGGEPVVAYCEPTRKQSVFFYSDGVEQFYKIVCYQPKDVAGLRTILEKQGLNLSGENVVMQTFESNLPYFLRFMIDQHIVGMQWVRVKDFTLRDNSQKTSMCQIEADCSYLMIEPCPLDENFSHVPPIRILSFDIECMADAERFPTPEKDEVIQIGTVLKVGNNILQKAIFTLKGCAEIPDSAVYSYETEKEMLSAWRNYFQAFDPDVITGYNILNFDYYYLFARAEKLKLNTFPFFSRINNDQTRVKKTSMQTKAMGLREYNDVKMIGRVNLDMFVHIQKEHKLSSYSLNGVSLVFLSDQKEDLHYSTIRGLQNGTDETRRRIAIYCIKDCILPLELMDRLLCIINYAEMARVTGVSFNTLLTRGQQLRVAVQLYRKAKQHNMLIPTSTHTEIGDKYEGAFVLPPISGYYQEPIATLDFASLYPSIMIAHNLCYCTLLPSRHTLPEEMYQETPTGDKFVKKEHRRGLLPMILEELIAARKRARTELAATNDPVLKKVLDGRQLAIKIAANSVYGFTGAQVGQLPCIQISSSVTAFGRTMIEETKRAVEEHYNVANGYAADSVCIYGDTDSVMVKFGVETVEEAMILGKEAADRITQQFIAPIKLEFEKVYYPYLLITKKRYAGLLWTKTEIHDKIDCKGIESVRRDNCALVRDAMNTSLHLLLVERNKDAAVNYIKDTVSKLLQNRIDLSQLVITKQITKKQEGSGSQNAKKNTYVNKQAHTELAARMHARDPSTAPNIGDRVAYVMLKGAKGQKAYELAEDPLYVLQNDLHIDFDWYVDKQLRAPITRLFEAVINNVNELFTGEHTRKRYQPKVGSGALAMFVKVQNTCLGCKAPVKSGPVCANCKPKAIQIYVEICSRMNYFERTFNEFWSECQRCQKSYVQEVLCNNNDCPIFYRREKVKKDIVDVQKELAKFDDFSW